jgi:hypothetical protein
VAKLLHGNFIGAAATVRELRSRIRPLRADSDRKKVNLQSESTEVVRGSKVTKSISADKLFRVSASGSNLIYLTNREIGAI